MEMFKLFLEQLQTLHSYLLAKVLVFLVTADTGKQVM